MTCLHFSLERVSMTEPDTDEFMTEAEVAKFLKIGSSTLHRQRQRGDAPPCYRVPGTRSVRYLKSEVIAWATGAPA